MEKLSLCLSLLLYSSISLYAKDYIKLEEMKVVSASGYEQDVKNASASMSIVSKDELSQRPIKDLGDMIEDMPGVDMTQSGSTGAKSFTIRGFNQDYVLFLIDGKRQNPANGLFQNGMNSSISTFIPPASMIERVEIIKGPASVLYGSDAVGGVVNIITKKHPDVASGSISVDSVIQENSDFGNKYGMNGFVTAPLMDEILSFNLRFKSDKRNASLQQWPKTITRAGKVLDMPNRIWNAKTLNLNFGSRLIYSPNDSNTFYIDIDRSINTAIMQSGHPTGNVGYYKYVFKKDDLVFNHDGIYDFGTTNTYLQYNHMWNNNEFKGLDTKLYTAQTKAVIPYNSFIASLGAKFEKEEVKVRKGSKTIPFNGTREHTMYSVFGEGEYYITDDLIFTGGLRLINSDIFDLEFTPRAYLVWHLNDDFTIKGGVSRGYKTPAAPLMNDGVGEASSDSLVVGNPELKPEESWNYELGIDFNAFNIARANITAFVTDFDNKISRSDETLSGTIGGRDCIESWGNDSVRFKDAVCRKMINIAKTQTKGIEFGLKTQKFNGFSANTSYTYMEQKYKSGANSGKRIENLPKHTAMVKLNYEANKLSTFIKASARLDTLYKGRTKIPNFKKYDDYYIVDLGASYKISKNFTINAAINNLFNKNFFTPEEYTTAKGTPGFYNPYQEITDGRNFWINFVYEF